MKKTLLSLLCLLSVGPALATGYVINCSNALRTVSWSVEGEDSQVRLAYDGFIPGVLELTREQVTITLTEEKVLRESPEVCRVNWKSRSFAATATITPSEKTPDVFQSYFPDQKVMADVICEEHVPVTSYCPSRD